VCLLTGFVRLIRDAFIAVRVRTVIMAFRHVSGMGVSFVIGAALVMT
jgi:hypothetical protein